MITNIELIRFKKFHTGNFALKGEGISLLAGPNNSGKSTLLHALAVWSFCVFVLRQSKGDAAVLSGYSGQGTGISEENFSPINLPDLKHLWCQLKPGGHGTDGYSLSIKVDWMDADKQAQTLTIKLSFTNDRLFIKAENSSLLLVKHLPNILYLPPVAGLDAREPYATQAIRRAKLGRGMAGSILRNILLDLRNRNDEARTKLKGSKAKISSKDLRELRATDPWERLQEALRRTFEVELVVGDYDETYHTSISVFVQPITWNGTTNRYTKSGAKRDLMVEGSGALQWICVYAYAVNPEHDVLLLDEPDAHLHSSLQSVLMDELRQLLRENNKQVLMATHSREVLLTSPVEEIFGFNSKRPKYLVKEHQRTSLFAGLGEDYDPFIDKLRKSKRVFFAENESDFKVLQTVAKQLGKTLPEFTFYPTTESHKERRKFYLKLKSAIPELKAISLRDRDEKPINQVCETTLRDKSDNHKEECFFSRTWRRREIENYAFVLQAIARAANIGAEDLKSWWEEEMGLAPMFDYTNADGPLDNMQCKDPLNRKLKELKLSTMDVWTTMSEDEIHGDVKILVSQMAEF
ncbi:AAA family ATPase [Shimia sp. NS0008-38b]|uniref:ATP-dependent nuclease n=1 Tax=Shimia sp. NS0008-38b TaxID=3127653 RepID=UPI00333F0F01